MAASAFYRKVDSHTFWKCSERGTRSWCPLRTHTPALTPIFYEVKWTCLSSSLSLFAYSPTTCASSLTQHLVDKSEFEYRFLYVWLHFEELREGSTSSHRDVSASYVAWQPIQQIAWHAAYVAGKSSHSRLQSMVFVRWRYKTFTRVQRRALTIFLSLSLPLSLSIYFALFLALSIIHKVAMFQNLLDCNPE